MQESKALIRVQQISVLYLVIWTISPFMEIDNIWRIGALAAFGLWLICAMSRGLHLEKIHMLAFAFIALVVVVNIIENNGRLWQNNASDTFIYDGVAVYSRTLL